jgi:hypothetical protein
MKVIIITTSLTSIKAYAVLPSPKVVALKGSADDPSSFLSYVSDTYNFVPLPKFLAGSDTWAKAISIGDTPRLWITVASSSSGVNYGLKVVISSLLL